MELKFRTFGELNNPALVIVHGLYGSMSNWSRLAARFAENYYVITPDMRNHGRSPWSERHDYLTLGDDLAELINQHANANAHVIGHSMGGKAAMALALTHEEVVNRLIIADIAPVTYERADHVKIMSAMNSSADANLKNREEVDEHLAAALNHRPNSLAQKATRAFLLQNLVKITSGEYSWRINLKTLSEYEQQLRSWPKFDATYSEEALFLYGEKSDYVLPEYYPDIKEYFPEAQLEGLANAGHWLHAEQPEAFFLACNRFLAR